MSCTTGERINGMQNENTIVQDTKKAMVKSEKGPKLSNDEAKSSITELFPWLIDFRKMCRCIHTDKSMASLTELMQFYARNVSISVNECYTKPLRAAKLKDCISETLLLFLYIYRELSEDHDRSVYLNNMSDLLAMYVDMELKASRKSKEDHDKICARLTSCLYVYLEHSTEHLLDTLMKIQFTCQNYHHILDPIITKIIKSVPLHPESNIMYIRYFLIYSLWRKINGDVSVRNQITTAASVSLGPPPTAFPPSILEDVLPKVPKCQPNSTKALLQQKFDIKKCCELFVQFCRDNSGNMCQKMDECASPIDSSSRIYSKMPEDITNKSIGNVDDNVNSIILDKTKQNESISLLNTFKSLNSEGQTSDKNLGTFSNNISTKHPMTNSIKSNKDLLQRKSKKSNEIVIIDLTNDVAFEKCIKKRKSRKLPWLEEVKKRIDLKIVEASRKKKKRIQQEAVSNSFLPDNTKNFNCQSQDAVEILQVKEITNSKNSLNTIQTTDITIREEIHSRINSERNDKQNEAKKISDLECNSKEIDIKTSCSTSSHSFSAKQPLDDHHPSTKQVLDAANVVMDVNNYNGDNLLDTKDDGNINGKLNEQTVIKRLIETNTLSDTETFGRAESLKKICDLETECPHATRSNTICTQCNSKDNIDNFILSNLNVAKNKLAENVTSSTGFTVGERSGQNVSNDETVDVIDISGKLYISEQPHQLIDLKTKCSESSIIQSTTDEHEIRVFIESEDVETFATKSTVKYEEIERTCIPVASSQLDNTFESPKDQKLLQNELTNDRINFYETNEDLRKSNSSRVNNGEFIFESYSADKKDTCSALKITSSSNATKGNIDEVTCANKNANKFVESVINDNCQKDSVKPIENYHDESSIKRSNSNELSSFPSDTTTKKACEEFYNVTAEKDSHNISKSKFIVQDSELQDSIDGLSLLASVSQHIPHLKAESEAKCEQIKVKDYATMKDTCYEQATDDEADTNDSSNTVSQLLENPSTEIINRIVGIYPDDNLDKVALHVEITSSETSIVNAENETCNTVPNSETHLSYETDALSHNLATIENNIQTTKENTNVILNGETVVLLQKSPNSNLYIINKAVENLKDHNEDDMSRLKDKSWLSPPEECGQFEVISSVDHASFNLDLTQYNKELPYQETKFAIGRNKGIKIELDQGNLTNLQMEAKSYTKKISLSTDILPVTPQMYQEVNVLNMGINKSVDKRKPSKTNLAFRQNIKQEFNNISNHMAANCSIQGCNGIHSHPHEVDAQHALHIPVTRPTTLPPMYGTDLCVPYHKHCTSVSCNLPLNATTSLHSHSKSGSPCGRSHCTCLNCTYDIVAHCRQCIHPPTDTHVSCIESNPYFLPTHSSVQTPAVQEHDRTKTEAVISKLYDEQLLCKIESSLLQSSPLEKLEVQRESEKLLRKDMDNKLPLKKRLKAHAMMSTSYEEVPIKAEKADNYPGIPMMSIAALEVLDNTQKRSIPIVKSEYKFSCTKDEIQNSDHVNSNLVRRDYCKDSSMHHNVANEGTRKQERQFCSANEEPSGTVCREPCQPIFKTSGQRKEISATSLKRLGAELTEQEESCKKIKKPQSPLRQTRSSKRKVPKVNYCYTDVDPEWNPSGESKRKRKKTSR